MNKIEAYRLSQPELLPEEKLREILVNSCIVLPAFGTLGKDELVEIFKRIALPMSQRRYNDSRTLGKRLNGLRVEKGVEIADYSESTDYPSATSPPCDGKKPTRSAEDATAKDRLKPPISDGRRVCKKIRLSDSHGAEIVSEKDVKRKSEVSSLPDLKKRQKITWP